jgi:hypothetical protein
MRVPAASTMNVSGFGLCTTSESTLPRSSRTLMSSPFAVKSALLLGASVHVARPR